MFDYFIVTPPHLAFQTITELKPLGAHDVKESPTGIHCRGDLAFGYKACLHSRVANRVLLKIGQFNVTGKDDLYEGVKMIDWNEHLGPRNTLAVSATTRHLELYHSLYVTLRVKDAIIDHLRQRFCERPGIEKNEPDVLVHAHLDKDSATIYIDLSGKGLHKRGYRQDNVIAPIKENIAAAMLRIAGWAEAADRGESLIDPMCGSGTIPVEAALIATHTAPGISRHYFGFLQWRGHDKVLWRRIRREALDHIQAVPKSGARIVGFDENPRAIDIARQAARIAGIDSAVRFEVRSIRDARPVARSRGIVVSNPPYGRRLGHVNSLRPVYADFGRVLRDYFRGYQAHILTSSDELAHSLGLRAFRKRKINNGGIECELLDFAIEPGRKAGGQEKNTIDQALLNRLKKNFRHMIKWAECVPTEAYRVYDADLPDYNFALDIYGKFAHLQEYEAPGIIPASKTAARASTMISAVEEVLKTPRRRIAYKMRKRQRGNEQYSRLDERERFMKVKEQGHVFLVNLWDYVDTGLFLDHRPLRAKIQDMASDKRFLNLFSYTGSATVYAAAGNARETTSVDISKTYLAWARRNMKCNGFFDAQHLYVCADVREWLKTCQREYDLIFIDPPTFSNKRALKQTFDVKRDHVELVHLAAKRLDKDGLIYFSTNQRNFKFRSNELPTLSIKEITKSTLPEDFKRKGNIHACFEIRRKPGVTLGELKKDPLNAVQDRPRKRAEGVDRRDKKDRRPGPRQRSRSAGPPKKVYFSRKGRRPSE